MLKSFITKIFYPVLFSFVVFSTSLTPANATFNGLTPCSESPAFQKRLNSSVKKLENRFLPLNNNRIINGFSFFIIKTIPTPPNTPPAQIKRALLSIQLNCFLQQIVFLVEQKTV